MGEYSESTRTNQYLYLHLAIRLLESVRKEQKHERNTEIWRGGSAITTSYDNTASGLSSTNVQDALDHLRWASEIKFENTGAPTTATNVQNALWEALNGMPDYTYASATSNYGTTVHIWKYGHLRFLVHNGNVNFPAANTVYSFATLPNWAKPGITIYATCLPVNTGKITGSARFQIGMDGAIHAITSVAGNQEYNFFAVLVA